MQIPPTCMWAEELSLVRNETSSALSRSMCPCAMGLTYPSMRPRRLRFASPPASCSPAAAATRADAGGGRRFDGDRAFDDLAAQVDFGPRPAGSAAAHRTAEWIADRMRDAGVEDVTIQSPWENVLGTIPGSEPGTVVVGAHYDTKSGIPGFVGANDGASGVAVLHELARSLPTARRAVGAAGRLRRRGGARQPRLRRRRDPRQPPVRRRRAPRRPGRAPCRCSEIRAMVLFDLVGDCELRIPLEENSDPALYGLFAEAATEAEATRPRSRAAASPSATTTSRSSRPGVPAVDLIDFDFGPGPTPGRYWHTPEDTLDKVCAESLDAVGEAALGAIPRIR